MAGWDYAKMNSALIPIMKMCESTETDLARGARLLVSY